MTIRNNGIIIGIDPGKSGAVAVIDSEGKYLDSYLWEERTKEEWLALAEDNIGTVIMEDVTLISKSSKAMSGFYRNVGWWECFFEMLGEDVVYVNPRVWQKHFELLEPPKKYSDNFTKKEKDKAKREAKEAHKRKLKDFAVKKFGCNFKRRKDWDKADALLIAEYGRQHYT